MLPFVIPAWLGWGLYLAVCAYTGTLGAVGVALLVGVALGALCFLPLGLLYTALGLAWCAATLAAGLTWCAARLPSWAIWPVCLATFLLLVAVAGWHS